MGNCMRGRLSFLRVLNRFESTSSFLASSGLTISVFVCDVY